MESVATPAAASIGKAISAKRVPTLALVAGQKRLPIMLSLRIIFRSTLRSKQRRQPRYWVSWVEMLGPTP